METVFLDCQGSQTLIFQEVTGGFRSCSAWSFTLLPFRWNCYSLLAFHYEWTCVSFLELLVRSLCLLSACCLLSMSKIPKQTHSTSLFLVSAHCAPYWRSIEGGYSSIPDLHEKACTNPWGSECFWLWERWNFLCVHQENSWELLLSLSRKWKAPCHLSCHPFSHLWEQRLTNFHWRQR